jgi:hypothetical protein
MIQLNNLGEVLVILLKMDKKKKKLSLYSMVLMKNQEASNLASPFQDTVASTVELRLTTYLV